MVKQRCGTCRFFQEAGLAGSGWCHHPQRKTTSDLMIMVRKNELACRDAWSHSLWEGGTFVGGPPLTGEAPEGGAPFAGRPVAPATETEIAALLRVASAGVEAAQEDVVLSAVRVLPDEPPDRREEPTDARSAVDLDTRSAVIRAREAYRGRLRPQPPRSEPAPLARTGTAPAVGGGPASATTADPSGRVADRRDVEGPRPEPAPTSAAPPTDPHRLPPDHDRAEPPAAGAARPALAAGDAASPRSDRVAGAEAGDSAAPAGPPRPHPDATPRPRSLFSGLGRSAPVRSLAQADSPLRDSDPRSPVRPVVDRGEPWSPHDEEEPGLGPIPVDGGTEAAPPPYPESMAALPTFGYRSSDVAVDADAIAATLVVEPPDAGDPALPLPVVGPELAPELPRVCRTCRDFRPAEAGDRGWCGNRWAFDHRRMVHAGDAAPCAASFGSWWLPVDEVWASAVDVAAHGQPTPLLDHWVEDRRSREPQRRRS